MSRAFEAKPSNPAIHSLVRLHADQAGKVQANKEQRERLLAQVAAVETVIRLFDPAFEMRKISARRRVTGNPWFKRGECFRHALDVLREATAPLTTTEIVRAMLAKQGVAEPTGKQVRNMYGAIQRSLQSHDGRSVTRVGEGMPARWAIAG
jgi:hypothetical protein